MPHGDPLVMELRGRLGNQLFIFATGYAAALRTGARLRFYDVAHLGASAFAPLERLIGDAFVIASPRELLALGYYDYPTPARSTLAGLAARLAHARAAHGGSVRFLVEEQLGSLSALHPQVLEARPPAMLAGFFHNEGYFADHAREVSEAITLPAGWERVTDPLPRPLVSVTFRRGDYVDFGWNLPLAYYYNALEHCRRQLGVGSLLLSSDDPEFLELAAPWLERYGEVHLCADHAEDPLDQMALISLCDHHVLSNSSFAWWAAWLGEQRHEEKTVVIAPAGWIHGDEGIIPKRWLTLPTSTDDVLPWTLPA